MSENTRAKPAQGSDEELIWFGANARARNESVGSNPYAKPPYLPGDMAEAPESRARKATLWEIGWRAEDGIR